MLKVSFQPINLLRVRGAGDRLAYAPGPGAVLSDDPLLPRLETIIGAIVNALGLEYELYSHEEMVEAIFGKGAKVYGPFLVKEREVYANVRIGYLKLERNCLDKYFGAFEYLNNSVMFPKDFDELKSFKKEMKDCGCLVFPERFVFRSTHVALDYSRKSAQFGLLYSMSALDLRGSEIVILVDGKGDNIKDLKVVNLPNSRSVAKVSIEDINAIPMFQECWRLALSPVPLDEVSEARPNPFYKSYEVVNYIVGKSKKVRLGPEPALPQGSLLKYRECIAGALVRALDKGSLECIAKALVN